jgi:hypothetical protein
MNISIPSNHSLMELHEQIRKELLRRNLLSYLKIYNNKRKTSGIEELDEIPPPNIVYDLYAMVLENDNILSIPDEPSILLEEYIKENTENFLEKQKSQTVSDLAFFNIVLYFLDYSTIPN